MIISFSGDLGSGKSTIAKKLATDLKIPRYYMGQFLRDMATERGMNLADFLKLAEKNDDIDKKADQLVLDLAKKEKDFIIESRTAWHFIPQSFKIYLTVNPLEGAKRIFQSLISENRNRQNEDGALKTLEDVLSSNQKRKIGDDARYKKYYGIDVSEMKNYDFVLDTTKLSIQEVYQKVFDSVLSQK